jgi:hypothetical protein
MKLFQLVCLLGIFAIAHSYAAQTDAAEIHDRITALEQHSSDPAQLLDPQLQGPEREKSLSYLSDKSYKIVFNELSEPTFPDREHAIVGGRMQFKDAHNDSDMPVDLRFVKRQGRWYFASYEFLGWPAWFVIYLILGSSVGIGFASGVLVLRGRLLRSQQWNAKTEAMCFVPVFWPALWKQTADSR